MSYELNTAPAHSGQLCRYGESKLLVRGPARSLDAPYLAFLGSTEVYGRFVDTSFPSTVEMHLGRVCVNLGSVNGGLDSYYYDSALREVAQNAEATVIQLMGAQNISNQFYKVHPRRNDRFLRARDELSDLCPEVDFTEFHFNKHMLTSLKTRSPESYALLCDHLKETWVARMSELIQEQKGPVILVWMRYDLGTQHAYTAEPVMVDRGMVDALRPRVAAVVELEVQTAGAADDIKGMKYGQLELPTARLMIGPRELNRVGCLVAEQVQHHL